MKRQLPAQFSTATLLALGLAAATGVMTVAAEQLRTGASVNIVSGPASITLTDGGKIETIIGDPYLRSQNEPSIACSVNNPQFCLAASNDTRLVSAPGLPNQLVTGDAWIGIFWTHNGGRSWTSTVLPGFPQDGTSVGMGSPIYGKEAAADPTVRAAVNASGEPIFYVSGIAFNRDGSLLSGQAKKGVTFVAVYKDPGRPDQSPVYDGTFITDTGTSGQFLDKPWIASDIARNGAACGRLYFAATVFTGSGNNNQSKVLVNSSGDCGRTWASSPQKVSESFAINQSANLAIDPRNGDLYVAWRVFGTTNQNAPSQILLSKQAQGTTRWSKPTVIRSLGLWGATTSLAPDQGTLPTDTSPLFRMFRTNMYPNMCITSDGVIRIAFAERKGNNADANARIQVATFRNNAWTVSPLDDHAGAGNQLMPAMACAGPRAVVVWYDQRRDGAGSVGADLSNPLVYDIVPPPPTHTLDVRAAQTNATGNFGASIQVSRYRMGRLLNIPMQIEFNAVNWPLFGLYPFMGDYIDVESDKKLMPYTKEGGGTGWRFFGVAAPTPAANPAAVAAQVAAEQVESPVFHAVWADNRDVIPSFLAGAIRNPNAPGNGEPQDAWLKTENGVTVENWQAPGIAQCTPGVPTASKNQNVYTATLSEGLVVGILDESSAANGLRGYAFFVANTSTATRRFKATTDHGSFEWQSGQPVQTSVLLDVPPGNTRAATVFLSGALNPLPTTTVKVEEQDLGNGAYLALTRSIVVNPLLAGGSAETHNIDLEVHVGNILTVENPIFDPQNPIFDPQNPIFDPQNPIFDPQNPIFDPQNPIFDPQNPIFDPQNPIFDPQNPIFEPQNPIFEPQNPIFEPQNPIFDPQNAALDDGKPSVYDQTQVTQISATITNQGNVATGYDFSTVFATLPADAVWQIIIARLTAMPATTSDVCKLSLESRVQSLTNIGTTDTQATSSLVLNRGEKAVVLVRIYHSEATPPITPENARDQMMVLVESQAPNEGEIIPRSDVFGNRAPTADDTDAQTSEDQAVDITLPATDPDEEDQVALTYSIVDEPAHGTVILNGAVATYTPNANFSGSDSFTFRVHDGGIFSNIASVSITVGAVNDAPTAADGQATTSEDNAVGITLQGADIDNDTLTYAIVTGPASGVLTGSGAAWTYTPNANFAGSDSFTFKTMDGQSESNTATVSIAINAVNDAPTANAQTVSLNEDGTLAITLGGFDVEGSALSYSVVGAPTHGTLDGTAPLLTYRPAANYHGADAFSFTVNDGSLGSAAAVVSITVVAVDDAPAADSQSVSTQEDTAKAIVLTGSDIDGDTLTFAVTAGPSNGSLSGTAPNLTYTPAANFNGVDSFSFTATGAGVASNTATVTVTVGAVNDAPVAIAPPAAGFEDTALGILLGGSDVEGSALTFSVLSGPTNGSLSGIAPNLTYIPNPNFHGADTFSFRVNDGTVDSAPANVAITIAPVNDAPVAANDNAGSIVAGGSVAIGVLSNDSDVDDAPTSLRVAAITQAPLQGTAAVSADGRSIVYTASLTFAGPDSFSYTTRDAAGAVSNVATVSINTTLNISGGLLAPYVAPPKKSYNLGQAIPLVWQFKDASGAVIDSSWAGPMLYVTFTKKAGANATTCAGGSDTGTVIVNEDVPGNSNFQYFSASNPHSTAGANTWQFNWQTNPPVTSGCWNARVVLDLNNNSVPDGAGDQVMGPFLFLIKP